MACIIRQVSPRRSTGGLPINVVVRRAGVKYENCAQREHEINKSKFPCMQQIDFVE